jgi:hypothetical protein
MKILMTVTLAMLVSASVFAECKKEGDSCTKEECAKIGTDMGVNEAGKCVKVAGSQTDTQCAGIVGTSGSKQVGVDSQGKSTQGSGSAVGK